MEVEDFSSSIDSLNSLVEEYKGLERQMDNPTPPEPRLEIFKWRRAWRHYMTPGVYVGYDVTRYT